MYVYVYEILIKKFGLSLPFTVLSTEIKSCLSKNLNADLTPRYL